MKKIIEAIKTFCYSTINIIKEFCYNAETKKLNLNDIIKMLVVMAIFIYGLNFFGDKIADWRVKKCFTRYIKADNRGEMVTIYKNICSGMYK